MAHGARRQARRHDGHDTRNGDRHDDRQPSGRDEEAAVRPARASLRAATGSAVAAVAVGALGWWLAVVAADLLAQTRSPVPLAPEQALTLLASLVGLATATWLAVGVLLGALAHLPGPAGALGRRAAAAVAPAFTRRAAAVLVGASLGGALAPGTATAGDVAPATPAVPAAVSAAGASSVAPSPAFTPSEPGPARALAGPATATPATPAGDGVAGGPGRAADGAGARLGPGPARRAPAALAQPPADLGAPGERASRRRGPPRRHPLGHRPRPPGPRRHRRRGRSRVAAVARRQPVGHRP